jgi:NADPH-dependent 2,4-dienoyl-CoA reductase/sulfur reductase-like enzyme
VARRPPVRYLIVGGGPAGTLAAQEARKLDPEGTLRIVTAEPFRLYNRTLLSKEFLLGADASRIFLKDPAFYERRRIELETEAKVIGLDTAARTATLSDGSMQPWERLLVATGADPVRPDLEGAGAEGVCVLRSLADASELRERAASARNAVCVGGGFVGVETACALRELGLEVELLMLEDRVWPELVPAMLGDLFADRLRERGVRLRPATRVSGFGARAGRVREVRTAAGARLAADVVVVGVGVRPAVGFLSGSGVAVARGVRTRPTLETRVPGVFAAGDAAEPDPAAGGPPRLVGHWASATGQGRVAGANLTGRQPPLLHDEVPVFDTRVFDLDVGFVGEPRGDLPFALHGDLAEGGLIAFFLEGERVAGTLHVNRTAEMPAARELVRSRRPADPRALAERGIASELAACGGDS